MRNIKTNYFDYEKAKKKIKNMAMELFLDSHGPIFRAKNEKNSKVKKTILVDFFKKSLVIFVKKRPLCKNIPCLKFMNPKKKSHSFNWAGSLTNRVVFYLIKKLKVNKAQAKGEEAP